MLLSSRSIIPGGLDPSAPERHRGSCAWAEERVGPWAPSQERRLQSRSSRPCCSASERCCCLLITLIIENYRFSVGNVYLHPTFPKLPISIAVMSHPPVRFRQRWPPRLRTTCCCRTGQWPGDRRLPPGTVLARALRADTASRAVPELRTQAGLGWEVPARWHRRAGDSDGVTPCVDGG